MSDKEPVSAFQVFQAAKHLRTSNKNAKKKQNGSAKSKTNKNGKINKKFTAVPVNSRAGVKIKTLNMKKHGKSKAAADKNKPTTTNTEKQPIKNDEKQKLEEYLTRRLQIHDDEMQASSGCESSETDSSDSEIFRGEYIINASLSEGEDRQEQSSGSSDSHKKRKSLEFEANKPHPSCNVESAETKKIKKDQQHSNKGGITKDLPAATIPKAVVEDNTMESQKMDAKWKTDSVKLKPLSPPENVVKLNSIEEGKRALEWLLNPVSVTDFFANYWERKACLIKRQQSRYFSNLISFESIDQMLLQNHVEFTKNIDVTSYKNGIRETLNPEGRALPPAVWDYYGQGCSIRLLNPQTFLTPLHTLSATMQEYFHCLVGANAYLTPPNSQGFAPHYDDIEAFVLQIEGRKKWKLYKPRHYADVLPRYSSENFNQSEIGKPVLSAVLEPGDVLYFPRGTIHQACTEPGYHSLHITLSAYQKQSYADLFEQMLPLMLQKAIASNLELRKGLPLHTFQHAGITYGDHSSKERDDLLQKATELMRDCITRMPLEDIVDAGVDQLAKRFQREALPPKILPAEKLRTVFGSRSRTNERGECLCDYDIEERTNVRLLRGNILRLVNEENKMRVYYYLENSREYCQYEPNFIEVETDEAASVEVLIKSYPNYIGVSQLPMSSDEHKINFATALWERGLLMMEKPFNGSENKADVLKRIMVVVESVVSGHKFNTVRDRLSDKIEVIRFDPFIQKDCVYRERKKIRSA